MVGGVAAVADEQPNVGGNHAVAASADDFFEVSRVVTEGEEGCWHVCNRFGENVVMKPTPRFGVSCRPASSFGGMRKIRVWSEWVVLLSLFISNKLPLIYLFTICSPYRLLLLLFRHSAKS